MNSYGYVMPRGLGMAFIDVHIYVFCVLATNEFYFVHDHIEHKYCFYKFILPIGRTLKYNYTSTEQESNGHKGVLYLSVLLFCKG